MSQRVHLAALAMGIALSLVAPRESRAHGALKRSEPARAARLNTAPRELRLTFTEAPVLGFTRIGLTGPGGAVQLGDLRIDSAMTVVGGIVGPLVEGTYTVEWQIAGKDGHPVRGRYTFAILPGATGLGTTTAPPADSSHGEAAGGVPLPGHEAREPKHHVPPAAGFDASSPAYIIIRWFTYIGLLGVIGAVAFRFAVLPRYRRLAGAAPGDEVLIGAEPRAASWGLWAAILLVAAALLRLGAQTYAVHGGMKELSPSVIAGMLAHTLWGWGWILQIALTAIVATALFLARRNASRTGAWKVALAAAFILAFTPGLAGHAVASPRLGGLAVFADGMHILGASGWLGSLAILLLAGIPTALATGADRRGLAVAHLVNAFSPTALGFAALAALSGVFAAWLHLGGLSPLWQTDYGRTLLVKLAVLSIVAGTGAYNWLRVRPSLGDDRGTSRIRRSATIEVAVAVAVLLVTAVLVATPTPVAIARDASQIVGLR